MSQMDLKLHREPRRPKTYREHCQAKYRKHAMEMRVQMGMTIPAVLRS